MEWLRKHLSFWEIILLLTGAFVLAFAPVAIIRAAHAQHNHDEGHPDYQNWASGKTTNCCNEKDCGDLNEDEVRESPTGTEVLVLGKTWCPVLKEHFIIKGKSPDWSKPHACIIKNGYQADECQRLLCYSGKGGV